MKIISGGQTGVDRAALDAAIAAGVPHGGWCPRGRLAEDGMIPSRYQLQETEGMESESRTERNVIDGDGTLIFIRGAPPRGGTALTEELAARHGKRCLVLSEAIPVMESVARLRRFIGEHSIETLNVAGPRESEAPGLGVYVGQVLADCLRQMTKDE